MEAYCKPNNEGVSSGHYRVWTLLSSACYRVGNGIPLKSPCNYSATGPPPKKNKPALIIDDHRGPCVQPKPYKPCVDRAVWQTHELTQRVQRVRGILLEVVVEEPSTCDFSQGVQLIVFNLSKVTRWDVLGLLVCLALYELSRNAAKQVYPASTCNMWMGTGDHGEKLLKAVPESTVHHGLLLVLLERNWIKSTCLPVSTVRAGHLTPPHRPRLQPS